MHVFIFVDNSVVLSIFTKLRNHHHYRISEHFHHLRKKPSPHQQSLPIPSSPVAVAAAICFRSLRICLSWMFHINGIIQYGAFVSGFFHVRFFFFFNSGTKPYFANQRNYTDLYLKCSFNGIYISNVTFTPVTITLLQTFVSVIIFG